MWLDPAVYCLSRRRLSGHHIRSRRILPGCVGRSLASAAGNFAWPFRDRAGRDVFIRRSTAFLEHRWGSAAVGRGQSATTDRHQNHRRARMMSEPKIAQSARVAKASHAAFYGLWLFIILVSVLDGFLALRYRHLLSALELNPVGRSFIAANDCRVWYLLFAKFMGTVVA